MSPGFLIETLEHRRLLAATQINFVDFSSTTNLIGNGFGGDPITSGNRLRLTRDITHDARTVWFGTAVPIGKFRSDFTFHSNASATSADGFTFTVQNGPTTALGTDGFDLGYAGIDQSAAAAFNMFNFANFGSEFGFARNGQHPLTNTDMSPIDMHNGHLFHATVEYDGTTMKVAVTDAADRSRIFNASNAINLGSTIGSDTAIVGFTAATGNFHSVQEITSWDFSGSSAPTFSTAAGANPNPATGKTTSLSALGADAGGESHLTYEWTTIRKPNGAKDPTFSVNGTNAAKDSTVRFFKAGVYRLRCTATNQDGVSTSSDVLVTVEQTSSLVRITPHAETVALGNTVDYDATMLDQFNHDLRAQPAFAFSLEEGSGTVDESSGLFTPSAKGHAVIKAAADNVSGVVGATVTKT